MKGYGKKTVSILVERYLRIEEGPSENTQKADYEAELRELIRQRDGEEKIKELFPSHIQSHADRLGVKMIKHQPGADPAAVIYDAVQYAKGHKIDIVLSDTAGRMHTNLNLMSQMEKICRVSTPDLIIFVDEAVAGNDAVERAAQFNDAVPIDGSILTKIDADAKGGAAISIAYITGKPILFFGIGQGYEDLKKFDPEWFIDQLFNQ